MLDYMASAGGESEQSPQGLHRRGKEWRERLLAGAIAALALLPFILCIAAIKIEAFFDEDAKGPVFFAEDRISRGRVIRLLKFRTLKRSAIENLGEGPTHIAVLEKSGGLTRAGRLIRQWYLDELPQLLNIVKGDMGLVGTRPYPIELYEEELARGITRKRDMPAGLVGPVQAHKGDESAPSGVALDQEYWEAFLTYPGWKLLLLDLKILARSLKVQLEHKGL